MILSSCQPSAFLSNSRYVELAKLQRMKVELQGEAGIDVEVYFAATLSEWIEALNTEVPQYTIEPLLLPQ